MPTARELLEQADALMKRNRARQSAQGDDDAIPELTEQIELQAPEVIDVQGVPSRELRAPVTALEDIPELTDAVEEIEAPSILPLPADEGEPSQWLDVDRGEVSITGPAPDSIVAVPPATLHAETAWARPTRIDAPMPAPSFAAAPVSAAALAASFSVAGAAAALPAAVVPREPEPAPAVPVPTIAEAPPDEAMIVVEIPPVAEPPEDESPLVDEAPTPAAVPDAAQWDALAEEIRMQVLQRIDIFTDTGMHEQLAARLQPIVDRASADLVTTINQQVGQLIRAYVAEAIEREIEKWRQGGG